MSGVAESARSYLEARVRRRGQQASLGLSILLGIAFSLDMVVVYITMGDALNNYEATVLMLMAGYLFLGLFTWLGFGISNYVLVRALGARARFENVLRVTAYAITPLAGFAVLGTLGRYLALRGGQPCDLPILSCDEFSVLPIGDQVTGIFGFSNTASSDSVFVAAFVVGLAFVAFAGALNYLAMRAATTLDGSQARIVAGVTTASFFVVVVYLTFL